MLHGNVVTTITPQCQNTEGHLQLQRIILYQKALSECNKLTAATFSVRLNEKCLV